MRYCSQVLLLLCILQHDTGASDVNNTSGSRSLKDLAAASVFRGKCINKASNALDTNLWSGCKDADTYTIGGDGGEREGVGGGGGSQQSGRL